MQLILFANGNREQLMEQKLTSKIKEYVTLKNIKTDDIRVAQQ